MTREIKFRAWDNKTKKLYYNIQNMYDGIGDEEWEADKIYNTDIPVRSFGDILNREFYKTPVMQFTGLLDKNGKEIYEGDILQVVDEKTGQSYSKKMGGINGSFIEPFVVEWKEYELNFGRGFKGNALEIIGNIYENPELTKNI